MDRVKYLIIPEVDAQLLYQDGVVAAAKSYVGLREQGQNRGPLIEAWQRLVGIDPGDPYCAAFVCAMHQEGAPAGYVTTLPNLASASKIWRFALRNPDKAETLTDWAWVRPGDIFVRGSTVAKSNRIRRGSLASGHTGIAIGRFDGEGIRCVEANTDIAGNREGQGVYERIQYPGDPRFVGWVRPHAIRSRDW